MPQVRPFRAVGYALDRYGGAQIPPRVRIAEDGERHPGRLADLTDLACPPYDVIDAAMRAQLEARDPHNAVRLELSGATDPHAAAAAALGEWLAAGVLARDAEEAYHYYWHARPEAPDEPAVQGVMARVLLEPYGDGIRAHEHTMPGPRADRLALLEATRTQLSPILAIYFDRSERYRHVMSRAWHDERRARDPDGLLHVSAPIEPDERLGAYLGRQRLFIADGHHRYETALAYQARVRSDPRRSDAAPGSLAADWTCMVLVNAELEELQVRATHRLVSEVDPDALRALVASADPLFQAIPVSPADLADRLSATDGDGTPAFGLVLPDDEGFLLVADPDALAARMRREPLSSAVQRLDTAALHAAILGDRLGLDPVADAGRRIHYTKEPADALAQVRSGAAQAAFLLRPTRLDQLAAVALADDVMPQKSTYFYPKLLTGMAFYSLEDD